MAAVNAVVDLAVRAAPSCSTLVSSRAEVTRDASLPNLRTSFFSPFPQDAGLSLTSTTAKRPRRVAHRLSSTVSQAQTMERQSADADVMGMLLRQRIVFLGHQVDDFVADATISQLLLLDAQDPKKDIRLFINCPGGNISSAMGIFDAIQMCRCDVSTIAFGLAASTASIILMGGTKGKRLSMPNSRIMVHQPLGGASGKAIDVEIQAKEIMYHKNNLVDLMCKITGRPKDQIEKDIDRDRYMSPVEAMEFGLIDGVIDKDMIIPLMPSPERVKPRPEYLSAEKTREFLIPKIDDNEIF